MTRRPLILICNDDGVHAPGIKHLWKALRAVADLVVIAPATEQSAVGQSITIRRPLRIEEVTWDGVEADVSSINGTPADCIKIALSVILPRKPDLIVSGINRGSNAGRNVLYSGTVAAVIEGALQNIPGIAFSMVDYFNPDYAQAEKHIPLIVRYVQEHPLPPGTFLNVNFPDETRQPFKGLRFAKQGREYWAENPEKREHPMEKSAYYWLGTKQAKFDEDRESDIASLEEGYASIVPINISDLTHRLHFEENRARFDVFLNASREPSLN